MKDGFKSIIGKPIAAVVVAKGGHQHTTDQVFLVFPDGTRFEIYGASFSCCSGVDKADGIAEYVESGGGEVQRVYGDASKLEPARALASGPESAPVSESLAELLTRDLNAWLLAKAVVEKARRE